MKKIILLFAYSISICDAPVDEAKRSGFGQEDGDETFVAGQMNTDRCQQIYGGS